MYVYIYLKTTGACSDVYNRIQSVSNFARAFFAERDKEPALMLSAKKARAKLVAGDIIVIYFARAFFAERKRENGVCKEGSRKVSLPIYFARAFFVENVTI
jgi:hypothetical protein